MRSRCSRRLSSPPQMIHTSSPSITIGHRPPCQRVRGHVMGRAGHLVSAVATEAWVVPDDANNHHAFSRGVHQLGFRCDEMVHQLPKTKLQNNDAAKQWRRSKAAIRSSPGDEPPWRHNKRLKSFLILRDISGPLGEPPVVVGGAVPLRKHNSSRRADDTAAFTNKAFTRSLHDYVLPVQRTHTHTHTHTSPAHTHTLSLSLSLSISLTHTHTTLPGDGFYRGWYRTVQDTREIDR